MTIYMIGTAIGALTLTGMADRFGRKKILLLCLILQTVIGSGVSFVDSIVLFTTLRFFVGFLNMVWHIRIMLCMLSNGFKCVCMERVLLSPLILI